MNTNKKLKLKKEIKFIIYFIGFVLFLSFLLRIISKISILATLRAVFGWLFIIFIPGYLVIKLFFADMNSIETMAYSFGISLIVIVVIGSLLDLLWEISTIPILVLFSSFIMLELIGLIIKMLVEKRIKHENNPI